jgi:hypothetical protein
MLLYCCVEGCGNTAHCFIDGRPVCAPCLDAMASMNDDNERWVRAALAQAEPFTGPEWVCEVCGEEWDSFHLLNKVCLDCRAVMPYLFLDTERRWPRCC